MRTRHLQYLSFNKNFSLENSASNQKTFQIVKEQTPHKTTSDHVMFHFFGALRHQTITLQAGASESGGAMRDRTADLLDANQTLSQLSYGPIVRRLEWWVWLDLN